MSVIDRLLIRGVRSFDDKGVNVIQFYTPLTLIVGQNGSGKTTIIECLKYATTGDMPPNSKGGAFAHDPQLANEKQVIAQVKFRFYNVNGKRNTVTRNFQVTQKKGAAGLTMKSLEQTISAQDEDDAGAKRRHNLSSRCADIDEEVPRQLGVSKPILENVIFCHQEESSWPLSEPSILKKKFDDIFEATKYTKALDHMKVLRKDRTNEIKMDKERLQSYKVDSERAEKMQKNLDAVEAQIQEKIETSGRLDREIKKITGEMKVFFESAVQYDRTINEVRTLQQKFQMMQDNLAALHKSMTPLDESDDELRRKRSSFQADLDTFDDQRRSKRRQLTNVEDDMQDLRRKHSRRSREEGQLLAEKEALDTAKRQRITALRELGQIHNIALPDDDLIEEEDILNFTGRLEGQLRNEKAKLDINKRENRTRENELIARLQGLNSEKAVCEQSTLDLTSARQSIQHKLERLRIDLNTNGITDDTLIAAKARVQTEREHVDETQKLIQQSKYEQKSVHADSRIKEFEDRSELLNTELADLNGHADLRARLAIGRRNQEKHASAITSLTQSMKEAFRNAVDLDMNEGDMSNHLNELLCDYEQSAETAERHSRGLLREVQQCEVKLNIEREKMAGLQSKVQDIDAQAARILEGQNYSEVLADFTKDREEKMNEISFMQQLLGYLQRQLDKAKAHQICPTCRREFDDSEIIPFETVMKKQMQTLPEKEKALTKDLEQLDERLDYLKALGPRMHDCERIRRDEIPASESIMTTQQNLLRRLRLEYDDAESQLQNKKRTIADLTAVKRQSHELAKLNREAAEASREVESTERSLVSSRSVRTMEEVQAELREATEQLRNIKKETQNMQAEKEKRSNTLNLAMIALTEAESTVKETQLQLKDRQDIERRLQDQEIELKNVQTSLTQSKSKAESLHEPIAKLENELKQLRTEQAERETIVQRAANSLQSSLSRMESHNSEIARLSRAEPTERLKDMAAGLEALENEVKMQEDKLESLRQALSTMEQEYAQRNSVQRNLDDNLRYREMQKSSNDVTEEIESYDLEQARSNKLNFDTKYEASKSLLNRKSAEQARLSGEISTLQAQMHRYKEELRDDFAGIHEKYVEQLIKVKTSEIANKDLETYSKALDSAIMGFHSLKMNEINTTIADLWQRTYQGTDIDSIQIKSDAESARGGRSYNYRVVMVKDDVEMDMRGRCSAGQKVLASIIIRLALAESFSANCGVLALDEPTTNLDRENIVALAGAIGNIIKERRRQAGFQLIVITHDEQFLGALGKTEFTDFYWRVTRDEKARSIIERQRVTAV